MPISSHELKFFPNRVFVETGCAGLGLGVQSALNAGFQEIFTIDINPDAYSECSAIFKDVQNVHISLGDCNEWLGDILEKIGEPCTVFLDANGWREEKSPPIDGSLEVLIKHSRKNHILLFDDMNHGKESKEVILTFLAQSKMVKKIREINPEYSLYLIDTHLEDLSHTFPLWVLVADPIKNRFPQMTIDDFVK